MAPLIGAILIVAACVSGDPRNKFEDLSPWLLGLGIAMLVWPVLRSIGCALSNFRVEWVDGVQPQSQSTVTPEPDTTVKSTTQAESSSH